MTVRPVVSWVVAGALFSTGCAEAGPGDLEELETEWVHYANDLGSSKYSPLDQ
ncbi:MAG: hypothetical protein HKN73_04970, partial [Gemmatimonadetes bacterium]|nr:hypothetical protein [Gemmatimonadota bacterium]